MKIQATSPLHLGRVFIAVALLSGATLVGCGAVERLDRRSNRDAVSVASRESYLVGTGAQTGMKSVTIQSGLISGTATGAVDAFLGIPFAKAPARWKAPQAPASWSGVRAMVKRPAPCLQPQGLFAAPLKGSSEDCLYLNVWTPAARSSSATLPVMVFIHGGGLLVGASSDDIYQGANLVARGNVVVVTIQYRLGLFGYLAHPSLTRENSYKGSGNYGLMDQIEALKWVNRNIGAFGGDPANVTLFGESAGAASVCALLSSPRSQSYFQRAIVESMNCPQVSLTEGEKIGQAAVSKLGCGSGNGASVASCLRSKPAASLVTLNALQMIDAGDYSRTSIQLNFDNYNLIGDPYKRFASGAMRKPVIIGSNGSEGSFFVPFMVSPTSMLGQIKARYGTKQYDRVLAAYPLSKFNQSTTDQAVAIFGDHLFYCPTRRLVRSLSYGGAPVFKYLFNHWATTADSPTAPFHAAELPFVFQNTLRPPSSVPKADDLKVEKFMLDYWTAFARTSSPNNDASPAWERYDGSRDNHLEIVANPSKADRFHEAECNLFDELRGVTVP